MWMVVVSTIIGLLAAAGLVLGGVSNVYWSVLWGLLVLLVCQMGSGLLMRRRITALMNEVQGILGAGQKRLQQKVNQWQIRPPGSIKQAQIELERDQRVFLEQAIARTAILVPYYRWSPLLRKQVNTLRMQLYFQMKQFDEVDRLLPNCLYLDPMTAAMRLARMYTRKDPELDRFFTKQTRRLRYGQGAILYALMSWIAVQRGELDRAHQVLIKACEHMENETLKHNRDLLANNNVKAFSNAGLGDEWYALGLEQPRVKSQRQRGPGRPF